MWKFAISIILAASFSFAFAEDETSHECQDVLDGRGQIRWALVDTGRLFKAFSDEKIPLNSAGLVKNREKVRAVTERELGKAVGPENVYRAIKDHHGGWKTRVLADGFDPYEGLIQNKTVLSDEQLLGAIKALADHKRSVIPTEMRADDSVESAKVIREALNGVRLTPGRLHQIATFQIGGGWPSILLRAGVGVLDKVKQGDSIRSLSDEKFIAIVKYLGDHVPDMSRARFLEQTQLVRGLTALRFQNPIAPSTIVSSGFSRFGGWLETLEVARIKNLGRYQKAEPLEFTEERVLELIVELSKMYADLTLETLNADPERFRAICFQKFFRLVTVEMLKKAAEEYFGTYLSAVAASGAWNVRSTFEKARSQ